MHATFWLIPVLVLQLVVTWAEPVLDHVTNTRFFEKKAPWIPPWVYAVTGRDEQCISSAGGNDSMCTYCTYPVTTTAVTFVFFVGKPESGFGLA